MQWRDRLTEIVRLGGLSLAGCDTHRVIFNSVPDPCAGSSNLAACYAEVDCEEAGGTWTGERYESRSRVDAGLGSCVYPIEDASPFIPDAFIPDDAAHGD